MRVTNPVLPGFHPDPSIVRVGEMYYFGTDHAGSITSVISEYGEPETPLRCTTKLALFRFHSLYQLRSGKRKSPCLGENINIFVDTWFSLHINQAIQWKNMDALVSLDNQCFCITALQTLGHLSYRDTAFYRKRFEQTTTP